MEENKGQDIFTPLWRNEGENLELLVHHEGRLCWEKDEQNLFEGEWTRLLDLKKLREEEEKKLCLWMAHQYPFMPTIQGGIKSIKERPLQLPKRYVKDIFLRGPKKNPDKIVFFPGTFRPWHEGHKACLELCPEGPIFLLPDQNPWKKSSEERHPFFRFQELALKLKHTTHSLYPGFVALSEGNPTYRWISKVDIPQKYLLLGEDIFLELPRWQRPEEVLNTLEGLFIVPRKQKIEELEVCKKHLLGMAPKLKMAFLPHHPWEGVSSSGRLPNSSL